jgi:hypothetical protein
MKLVRSTLVLVVSLLGLSACGGSGSGSSGTPSTPASYTIGGTLTGLGTGSSVTLLNNGGNALVLTANGTFAFGTAVASGTAYAVTVGTQPTGFSCSVANGAGTIGTANVGTVTVSCTANTTASYTVSGTVTGNTSAVTLTNNAGDGKTVAANGGGFAFSPQSAGSNWNVALTPPPGQVCDIANRAGTGIAANVSNVSVSCVTTTGTQTVGGTVSGLNGAVTLLNNGGDPLTISANGSFTFARGLSGLSTYENTVGAQPPNQTCSIFNASGTMVGISYTPTNASALNVSNIAVTCVTGAAYTGTVMLGAPTDSSVSIKLFSTDQNGTVSVAYAPAAGGPYTTTLASPFFAGVPATIKLTGLSANTRYYYLVKYQPLSGAASQTAEYSFQTARPPNSSFSFALQADSHLDENTEPQLYLQTLQNIAQDQPDFLIDLGDTFMTEKHNQALDTTPVAGSSTQTGSPPASTEQQVIARYRMELKYFDLVARGAPLFLANGNHDAEAGWIWGGTGNSKTLDANLATWASRARSTYFSNPDPATQSFYKGQSAAKENVAVTPTIPARASAAWYSWQWGDALFVVLDPYWNSSASSGWNMSLGQDQYTWLANTLSNSTAKFKFIFLHNLVGGYGSMRGGAEASQLFEWGGYDATIDNCSPTCTFTLGSNLFASKRPNWSMPIHNLLVANKVTAVFHGHDHFYGQQSRDGIVYQEVPQPSARNTSNGFSMASSYGYAAGTFDSSSGHLRITVSPTTVKSEYIRAWLPAGTAGTTNAANGSTRINRQVSQSWTCTYQSTGPNAGWCQ